MGLCSTVFVLFSFATVLLASDLETILTYSGSFEIRSNGKPWFVSATPFVVADGIRYGINGSIVFSGATPHVDRLLQKKSAEQVYDSDALGSYHAMRYRYYAGMTPVDMEIRAYDSMVVFAQTFPNGLNNPGIPDERKVLSGFPAFQWDIVYLYDLTASGYLTYSGDMTGAPSVKTGKFKPVQRNMPDGVDAGTPLCLFNVSGQQAFVISPLTQFMSMSPWHRHWERTNTDGQSYWGIDRNVSSVPAGFKAEVIMVYSPHGITKAMEDWGNVVRRYNGRHEGDTSSSSVLDRLGYWTGYGSYYYNNTGPNSTYEDVLLAVRGEAVKQGVIHGFFEIDNWWYNSEDGKPEEVITWDANNQSFPDRGGIEFFQKELRLPLVAYCGAWSSNTTYAKQNNGSYNFLIEGDYALPQEKEFWEDLFQNASQRNITHIYMDDLSEQYLQIKALQQELGQASKWFENFTLAAQNANITLTLSRAVPRMLLEASRFPSIIQVRVSAPYMAEYVKDQWDIGVTSVLAGALRLAAFKDTFWTHSEEPGNLYGKNESNPILHATVAVLSKGFVAPGDSANHLSSPVISWCCRGDGTILRPSKPAAMVDMQLIEAKRNTSVKVNIWSSLSTVDVSKTNVTSSYTLGLLLATQTPAAFNITPTKAFPHVFSVNQSLRAWAFDAETGSQTTWQAFSEDEPLTIPANCWNEQALPSLPCLFFVSPAIVTNGVTVHLCGENKFVPLSSQRVVNVNTTAGVVVTLQGQPGERVTFAYYVNDDRRIADVIVLGQGTAVVSLNLTVPLTTTAPTSAGPTTIFSSTPSRANKHRSSLQNCLVLLIAVMFIKNYGYYSSF